MIDTQTNPIPPGPVIGLVFMHLVLSVFGFVALGFCLGILCGICAGLQQLWPEDSLEDLRKKEDKIMNKEIEKQKQLMLIDPEYDPLHEIIQKYKE